MEVIDEVKVRAVVELSNELRGIDPYDDQYSIVLDRLDRAWRSLSPAEQDEVDRILGQRGLARPWNGGRGT